MRFPWLLLVAISISGVSVAGTLQPPISDSRPLRLVSATPGSAKVPRYGLYEVTMEIQGTYSNAFDPDEIRVDAEVKGPKGMKASVPGFIYRDYFRIDVSGCEALGARGDADWRIRFAPTEVGDYTLTVSVRDRTGAQVQSSPMKFRCVASADHGFVRVSKSDPRYFAFDDGRPYLPIGANICWGSGQRQTYDYDDWLPKYGESGCNYFRVWLGPAWVSFGLERVDQPADRYGVGKIDLSRAWRLDYVLDLATKHGQYVMLCFDSFNELRKQEDSSYPFWEGTPHNAANGGPLKEPIEFWTNPTMLKAYRDKLRYLVARYGWRTHVLSWEFWNEVDIISSSAYDPSLVTAWHRDMARYLRSIDPWAHLRTTSFAYSGGNRSIHSLPEMDFTQTHNYGAVDAAATLSDWQRRHESYRKPHIVGEFGCDAAGTDSVVDPTGIGLHNGIWSTVACGSSGAAMAWWWDNHIHPHDLYKHFAALSAFTAGVDFPRESFRPVDDASVAYADKSHGPSYGDVMISGPVTWDESPVNSPATLSITVDGVAGNDGVAGILHGVVNHPTNHNPLTVKSNLPHPVKLHVRVTGVSGYGGAHLVISRDGAPVVDKDMPDVNPEGKHDTLNNYDGDYVVEIPAGEHVTTVENTGRDWLFVSYVLEGAGRTAAPLLRTLGIRGRTQTLLWVQNTQHTWYRVGPMKLSVETQPRSILSVPGMSGSYSVEYWNTYTGKVTDRRTIKARDGVLSIGLPEIGDDIALKIGKAQ